MWRRPKETHKEGRRSTSFVLWSSIHAIKSLGVEHVGYCFATLQRVWMGRGRYLSFAYKTNYILSFSRQVVPDGFGVAYMTNFDGQCSAGSHSLSRKFLTLLIHRSVDVHDYFPQRDAQYSILWRVATSFKRYVRLVCQKVKAVMDLAPWHWIFPCRMNCFGVSYRLYHLVV